MTQTIRPSRKPHALQRLATVLFVLLSLPALARAADYDRWYVVLLAGQRAGWYHDWQTTDAGRITTANILTMTVRRGSDQIDVVVESEFVETDRGEPISARSISAVGADPTTREMTWTDAGIDVVTTQGDRVTRETKPRIEGQWLTPAAAHEFVRARLEADAQTIEYQSLDFAESLRLVTTTLSGFEPASAALIDSSVDAIRCDSIASNLPSIVTRTWLDDQGQAIRTEMPFGNLVLAMVMTDQATAMQEGEAPELMVDTLIRPNRPVFEPRESRTASYILSVTAQGKLPALPDTSVQTVELLDTDRARVTLDLARPAPAEVADTAPLLASSSLLTLADPDLIELTRTSLARTGTDPARRAEALRRAVYRHIRDKSMGVGFASASETCDSRAGDCSEHGVLLAALLRIDGIPSRVVSGLVYVDQFLGQQGVFGFHMWTQALIEIDGVPTWVDLDATLNPSTPYDATHIALALSNLDDESSSTDLATIATLLGTLDIHIERIGR